MEIAEEVKKLVKAVEIKVLLKEFTRVFEEPKTLPSFKRFNYKIPMKSSPYPVNIKTYKSSFIQNGEIKKLVIEMLLNGIIQHSVNPFAPLALLVEKKITLGDFT